MLLGVATSFLIYLIARRCFNKTVGLISLVISIFYGMFYIHEGVLLMESLVTFLNTLSIFLLLRIEDKPSYKNIAFAGISIGLSALARANILLFVPFILIWMLRSAIRDSQFAILKKFAFLCLVIALTISPATIRNYLVSGKFVLISTNGPVNLWIGNNPYAEGWFAYPPPEYSDKVSRKVKEKGDKAYIEEVARFAKEYPGQFIGLLFNKFLLFWDSTEIANNVNYELIKGFSWISKATFLEFGLICSLALLGILLSTKIWKKSFLLYLFILSFALSTILFFVTARYRIAFVPILILFSSFAIWWAYEKIRLRKFQVLSLSLIPLIFSFSLTYSRAIERVLVPYIHPNGIVVNRPDRLIFRDSRDTYGRDLDLNNTIKKEIVVEEDPSNFEKGILFFNFFGGNPPGTLDISINDKRFEAPLQPSGGLLIFASIKIPVTWLKKGVNTIILKPKNKVVATSIAIDPSYSFGRSYILNQSCKWERLKKGEFMLHLELIKNP